MPKLGELEGEEEYRTGQPCCLLAGKTDTELAVSLIPEDWAVEGSFLLASGEEEGCQRASEKRCLAFSGPPGCWGGLSLLCEMPPE